LTGNRMILHVVPQPGMIRHVRGIVDQRGVLFQLLSNLGMVVQVAIGTTKRMRLALVLLLTGLAIHEALWMLLKSRAHLGMSGEVAIQPGMGRQKLGIVHQMRVVGSCCATCGCSSR